MRPKDPDQPRFVDALDDWIADGHALDWVKVTVIDSGETGFELVPRDDERAVADALAKSDPAAYSKWLDDMWSASHDGPPVDS